MNPLHFSKCNAGLDALAALLYPASLNAKMPSPEGDLHVEVGDTVPDPTPTIEEQRIIDEATVEMNGKVRAFVMSLSPYMRCIVVRTYWFGQSPQKIANDLGRKRPAIYNALSRIPGLGQKFYAEINKS